MLVSALRAKPGSEPGVRNWRASYQTDGYKFKPKRSAGTEESAF